jgi:phospholipase/lecithinase/hemolysin
MYSLIQIHTYTVQPTSSSLSPFKQKQLDILYESGARSFLFLTVPPIDRAPLFLQQGSAVVTKLHLLIANYNEQLRQMASKFQAEHGNGGQGQVQITVFDTQPIFNALLDNAQIFGFVNQTGFCEAYQNGTPTLSTQTPPCAPVSSYL